MFAAQQLQSRTIHAQGWESLTACPLRRQKIRQFYLVTGFKVVLIFLSFFYLVLISQRKHQRSYYWILYNFTGTSKTKMSQCVRGCVNLWILSPGLLFPWLCSWRVKISPECELQLLIHVQYNVQCQLGNNLLWFPLYLHYQVGRSKCVHNCVFTCTVPVSVYVYVCVQCMWGMYVNAICVQEDMCVWICV